MFNIKLKNNKTYSCDSSTSIFEAAKQAGILLEHSCLSVRCKSCKVKILSGTTIDQEEDLVLSNEEKMDNYRLSCNSIPTSDLILDIEDLDGVKLYEKKIIPSKIDSIEKITKDIIKLTLRFPPSVNFQFTSGQYVNLIKGNVKRSYSIANMYNGKSKLDFYIKRYEGGVMSDYWFNDSKVNDLLRLEGPMGSFFYRESTKKNIIFLATGTGIAPVKSILENILSLNQDLSEKSIWIFVGARFEHDLFWNPLSLKNDALININYFPTLSKAGENWNGYRGYVQDVLIKQGIDLNNAKVYACGSNKMIESAKKLLIKNNLSEKHFFSDAFVCTN